MVSKEEYDAAVAQKDAAEKVMRAYWMESAERFNKRLATNPIFTDSELFYSRSARCPCGAGLAYPKGCGASHYWDCSAILKGTEDKTVVHTDQLPFSMYDIKGERDGESTRP